MAILEVLLLAAALSMDAFAVALASGIRLCAVSRVQTFRMAFAFGFFQFFMPVLGWFLGKQVRSWIEDWDHWLAFALLGFIGIKMIHEALSGDDETCADPTKGASLLILAVATSIDALAVGLSLAFLGHDVFVPALIIGLVCAAFTIAGLRIGCFAADACRLGRRAAILGGVVLIGIGTRILYEHGVFGA